MVSIHASKLETNAICSGGQPPVAGVDDFQMQYPLVPISPLKKLMSDRSISDPSTVAAKFLCPDKPACDLSAHGRSALGLKTHLDSAPAHDVVSGTGEALIDLRDGYYLD
jgi:hypothetical protein